MPFPVVKLVYLGLKQVSKPVANTIKTRAKSSPFLRNYILLPPAQWYHKLETHIKLRLMGLGRTAEVKPLNEAMAIDLAADMLGETIVFGVGAGILLLEYKRQQRNDRQKESKQNDRLSQLELTVAECGIQIEQHNAQLRELIRQLHARDTSLPQTIVDSKSGAVLKVNRS